MTVFRSSTGQTGGLPDARVLKAAAKTPLSCRLNEVVLLATNFKIVGKKLQTDHTLQTKRNISVTFNQSFYFCPNHKKIGKNGQK